MVRVEFRFKNAALHNALWGRFGDAAKQLHGTKRCRVAVVPLAAEVIGISPDAVRQLLRLEINPWITGGKQPDYGPQKPRQLNKTAQKLCEFLEQDPQVLFPPEIYAVKSPKVFGEIETFTYVALSQAMQIEDGHQLAMVTGPIEQGETRKLLEDAMAAVLSEREARILTKRFGLDGNDPMTLRGVGSCEGVCSQRVREIESKALRRLRHPIVADKLRAAL